MNAEQWNDKARGMMLGLAVGDALGAANEFKAPGTFVPVTDYCRGPHPIPAGAWTDDTSMAIALAVSMRDGWSPRRQLEEYCAWQLEGKHSVIDRCFDIGGTTAAALRAFRFGDPPAIDESAQANGSIMRLAPVVLRFGWRGNYKTGELVRMARQSSATTHPSEVCMDACAAMAVTMVRLAMDESLSTACVGFPFYLTRTVQDALEPRSWRKAEPPCRATGWVIDTLRCALWAVWTANSFEEAVLLAANLGDDADTVGAVAGQLAGAHWGESGIPQRFLDGLVRRDMIEDALKGLGY